MPLNLYGNTASATVCNKKKQRKKKPKYIIEFACTGTN